MNRQIKSHHQYLGLLLIGILIFSSFRLFSQEKDHEFGQSLENGQLVNQGFNRCIDYVNAWMKYADPKTGLIPRNITDSKDFWNAWDAAADNYPFMVLTASILMPDFFKGTALKKQSIRKLLPRPTPPYM